MVNKKGLTKALSLILGFFLIGSFFMFMVYLIQDIGTDYVVEPLHNISKDLGGDLGVSTQMMDNFDDIKTDYESRVFPADLFFLALWLLTLVGSVYIAAKASKLPVISFLGFLFIMIFFFLVMVSIVSQITDWVINEIFLKVFSDNIISTPIFDWVFENMGIISFIWAMLLLLVNQWSRINLQNLIGGGVIEE